MKDVFSSRGVNPKVAAFVPNELDASEDAISAWLDQNADVFGFEVKKEAPIGQRDIASLRQMDVVTQGAVAPERADEYAMKIDNAESADELIAFLRSQ